MSVIGFFITLVIICYWDKMEIQENYTEILENIVETKYDVILANEAMEKANYSVSWQINKNIPFLLETCCGSLLLNKGTYQKTLFKEPYYDFNRINNCLQNVTNENFRQIDPNSAEVLLIIFFKHLNPPLMKLKKLTIDEQKIKNFKLNKTIDEEMIDTVLSEMSDGRIKIMTYFSRFLNHFYDRDRIMVEESLEFLTPSIFHCFKVITRKKSDNFDE